MLCTSRRRLKDRDYFRRRAPLEYTELPACAHARQAIVLVWVAVASWAAATAADLSKTITTAVTLPAGSHRLVGNLSIASSGTLTLQAGASLQSTGNYGITVYGLLLANATSTAGCYIGAATKGFWRTVFARAAGRWRDFRFAS